MSAVAGRTTTGKARPMVLHIYRATTHDRDCPHYRPDDLCPLDGWRWRIRATNGPEVGQSPRAYQRLRDCAHGAGLVIQHRLTDVQPGWAFRIYGHDYNRPCDWRIVVDK